jgi:NAD(P)-dependent dehydrogenase (short-subunit alcohol dehydrogenase family)
VAFLARHAGPVAKVERENKNTHGIVADVSDKDAIYPAALQIVGELGGLEILINNASDLGPVPLTLLADTKCEGLEKAIATNVMGPFRLTKALLGPSSATTPSDFVLAALSNARRAPRPPLLSPKNARPDKALAQSGSNPGLPMRAQAKE